MKNSFKNVLWLSIFLFLLFPINTNATVYTRSSGTIILTAPKSKSYQWYVKKNKQWEKVKGGNRRHISILCGKSKNGYKYRCKLKKKWSKTEKIVVTDVGKRYQRSIDVKKAMGMFAPKCADGYCYVHCTNKALSKKVRKAIDLLNNRIGLTFIYTDSPHIADIIIQRWQAGKLTDSMWLRADEIDTVRENAAYWSGVTFSIDGLHYLVCVNGDYVSGRDNICYSVVMHELGHCIGIGHSNDPKSIMYYYCYGTIKMTQKDIENFRTQRNKLRSL